MIGKELLLGYVCCFGCWKGDWKSRRETHYFARHSQAGFVCHECCACQRFKNTPKILNFADFRREAVHKDTQISTRTYLKHDRRPSPWRQVPGWTLGLTLRDGMHDDFLGFCRDLVGSMLIDLVLTGDLGVGDYDSLLESLYMDMCQWAKDSRVPQPRGSVFSMASLGRKTTSSYPELNTTFKAASVKSLCFFIAKKVLEVHKPHDEYSKLRFGGGLICYHGPLVSCGPANNRHIPSPLIWILEPPPGSKQDIGQRPHGALLLRATVSFNILSIPSMFSPDANGQTQNS